MRNSIGGAAGLFVVPLLVGTCSGQNGDAPDPQGAALRGETPQASDSSQDSAAQVTAEPEKQRAAARRRAHARREARERTVRALRAHVRRARARARREAVQAAAEAEQEAAVAAAAAETTDCDPNYAGACLDPGSPDYDCEAGSGNGPDYVGTVQVVRSDVHDLDRDGDGAACDT